MKKRILLALFILPLHLVAQDEIDLSTIEELEQNLPSYQSTEVDDPSSQTRRAQERRYRPPRQIITMGEIEMSGIEYGSIRPGIPVADVKTNKSKIISRPIYVKSYRLSDENGFRYLINKDGETTYKVSVDHFDPIKEETSLYVPPTKYQPVLVRRNISDYDTKLRIVPEIGGGADLVSSSFISDILNDTEANSGYSSRVFANAYTDWKLPVKVGATVHFERSFYKVDAGRAETSSLSFGPLARSKNFSLWETPVRFMGQFRLSPFTTMSYENSLGSGTFKFNTYAILAAVEFPMKNFLGEFTLAPYYQQQWFSLKDQQEIVKLKSKSTSNSSFGLMISQAF